MKNDHCYVYSLLKIEYNNEKYANKTYPKIKVEDIEIKTISYFDKDL